MFEYLLPSNPLFIIHGMVSFIRLEITTAPPISLFSPFLTQNLDTLINKLLCQLSISHGPSKTSPVGESFGGQDFCIEIHCFILRLSMYEGM